ncbi:response regulator transcription factor [Pararobbsia alpina]|uniref:Transcriptional regulatory protein HprR n=1 Tax=Pararobbsia alpina TaxID=621374 RepID=A0A6S7C8I5_9BURK|nr:response regulator transcription factor [Pararobbsia alpina]CAB3783656.1 Transcriptional regulatory protein HprR [Pararobbsia alpina]
MRILLVSTSRPESSYLHKALRESAHSLQVTNDVRDAMYLASQDAFDAIVIVVGQEVRRDELHSTLPSFARLANRPSTILMLGHAAPGERARMLRAGADACFVLPYSIIEMQERLAALRRLSQHHMRASPQDELARLDPRTHEFVEGSQRLSVTKREYLVIECLLRHVNGPVARDNLIRYAWAEADDVDPASVNVVISRLRRKMRQQGFTTQVETINHFGYRLVH